MFKKNNLNIFLFILPFIGGQLKSKNGQKYIVNHRPDGYFIPRLVAVIFCVLAVAAMMVIFLLTYFLAAYR